MCKSRFGCQLGTVDAVLYTTDLDIQKPQLLFKNSFTGSTVVTVNIPYLTRALTYIVPLFELKQAKKRKRIMSF